MIRKVRGNAYRSTVVCIDSYEEQILKGRFYNAFQKEGIHFHSLMQFLQQVEHLLDSMELPQSFSAVRSFTQAPNPAVVNQPEEESPVGRLATFEIRILFRQNTSWQGCVTWLEEGREESFRSVLELSLLMDSALSAGKGERTPA